MEVPKRFIVVDDDNTNNLICRLSLQRFSPTAEIKIFRNADFALQYIFDSYTNDEQDVPTLLFLDINMPVISGLEFLELFNEFAAHIQQQFKIYILTASIDTYDKEKASSNLSVKAYLSKPLNSDIIQSILLDQ